MYTCAHTRTCTHTHARTYTHEHMPVVVFPEINTFQMLAHSQLSNPMCLIDFKSPKSDLKSRYQNNIHYSVKFWRGVWQIWLQLPKFYNPNATHYITQHLVLCSTTKYYHPTASTNFIHHKLTPPKFAL